MTNGKLILFNRAICSGQRSHNAPRPNLFIGNRKGQPPRSSKLLPLLILLCALSLTGVTPSGAFASKPVPTEPPWPLGCQWAMTGTPCGLLY